MSMATATIETTETERRPVRRAPRRRLEGLFHALAAARRTLDAPHGLSRWDGVAHVALISARAAQESARSVRRRKSSSASTSLASPPASTTFRRRAKTGGVEGDQTYYLANEARIRGKDKLHLKTDPPPDLAIEAVHSHEADAAIEVYRRFKVPEVWICDEAGLVILVLQPNGRYAESPTSAAFPFLVGGRGVRLGAVGPRPCPTPSGSRSFEPGSGGRSSRASDEQAGRHG